MVADAPPIESALPAFLEFAAGCVLVAHNAPFDVGFLRHFAARAGPALAGLRGASTPPSSRAACDARRRPQLQARRRWPGCSAPTTTPNHRALSDARATVDVLHGLMERLGGLGRPHARGAADLLLTGQPRPSAASVTSPRASPTPRASTSSATTSERVLYVGTSRDLRSRVRTYFTASETRSRMGEMVGLAESVTGIECATPLEAEVRELRLIAEHKPRYNRRSRFPEKIHFVKLTREPWPRLSLVRAGARRRRRLPRPVLVPQGRRAVPGRAARHLPGAPVQRPAAAVSRRGRRASWPRWAAACPPATAAPTQTTYAAVVGRCATRCCADPDEVVDALNRRMAGARRRRALRGGRHPPRPARRVRPGSRAHPAARGADPAARRSSPPAATTAAGGRSTSSATGGWPPPGVIPPGADAHQFVAELRASAETVSGGPGPVPAATRRGERADPALAGVPRRPAGRRRRRVELPVHAEPAGTSPGRMPCAARRTAWRPSTSPARAAPCTARSVAG